jgi:hypothetical protein
MENEEETKAVVSQHFAFSISRCSFLGVSRLQVGEARGEEAGGGD